MRHKNSREMLVYIFLFGSCWTLWSVTTIDKLFWPVNNAVSAGCSNAIDINVTLVHAYEQNKKRQPRQQQIYNKQELVLLYRTLCREDDDPSCIVYATNRPPPRWRRWFIFGDAKHASQHDAFTGRNLFLRNANCWAMGYGWANAALAFALINCAVR